MRNGDRYRLSHDRFVALAVVMDDESRVRTHEGDDWMVGGGEAVHELRLPRQELWRSLTGRRSRRAVQGYEWNTDPTPYLPAWVSSSFGWPAD